MAPFEGERDLPVDPQVVWECVRDARFLVECIPDAHLEGTTDRDHATCIIKPNFSFTRGTLDTSVTIVDATEPTNLRIVLASKGVGATSDVEIQLALSANGSGTRLHWTANITNLGGLLKLAPMGLVRGAAQKVIGDVLQNVEKKLTESMSTDDSK